MAFNFEYNGYEVTVDVEECEDGYGTGDSPTLYEVTFFKIIDEDGNRVRHEDLGEFFYDELERQAIEIFRE
jgi:hypothetical protein